MQNDVVNLFVLLHCHRSKTNVTINVIKNTRTGEETTFKRENNVYRMRVKLNESGFQRQG